MHYTTYIRIFLVVSIDNSTGNINPFCKTSYAFTITKELGLKSDSHLLKSCYYLL